MPRSPEPASKPPPAADEEITAALNLIECVLDTIEHDKSGLIDDWGLDNISDLVYNISSISKVTSVIILMICLGVRSQVYPYWCYFYAFKIIQSVTCNSGFISSISAIKFFGC